MLRSHFHSIDFSWSFFFLAINGSRIDPMPVHHQWVKSNRMGGSVGRQYWKWKQSRRSPFPCGLRTSIFSQSYFRRTEPKIEFSLNRSMCAAGKKSLCSVRFFSSLLANKIVRHLIELSTFLRWFFSSFLFCCWSIFLLRFAKIFADFTTVFPRNDRRQSFVDGNTYVSVRKRAADWIYLSQFRWCAIWRQFNVSSYDMDFLSSYVAHSDVSLLDHKHCGRLHWRSDPARRASYSEWRAGCRRHRAHSLVHILCSCGKPHACTPTHRQKLSDVNKICTRYIHCVFPFNR